MAGQPGFGGGERGGLGAVDDVEDLALFVGRLAVDERARHIRLVAVDEAAVVDEHHLAFANDLRAGAAVRECGPLADLAGGFALDAGLLVAEGAEVGEVFVGHSRPGGFVGGFVDGEGDVVRELHEGELGG